MIFEWKKCNRLAVSLWFMLVDMSVADGVDVSWSRADINCFEIGVHFCVLDHGPSGVEAELYATEN